MPTVNDPSVFVRRTGAFYGEDATDYNTIAEAAEANGFSESGVELCCKGDLETLGGYRFDFVAGVPKRAGNHYVPDAVGNTDSPVVHICIDTSIAYVRIDGVAFAKVADVANYVRCLDYDGVTGLYGLEDIGNSNVSPVVPVVLDESAKTEVVGAVLDALSDWDISVMLDGSIEPDDPIGMIESMKGRKVRCALTRRVYDDCFHVARCISCEPWRVHAACTRSLPCTNGYYYEWLDDPDNSEDCPDFEADFGL